MITSEDTEYSKTTRMVIMFTYVFEQWLFSKCSGKIIQSKNNIEIKMW